MEGWPLCGTGVGLGEGVIVGVAVGEGEGVAVAVGVTVAVAVGGGSVALGGRAVQAASSSQRTSHNETRIDLLCVSFMFAPE